MTAHPARLVHRVPAVAELLGFSEDFVRDQIRAGALRARRMGRYLVVTEADLAAYVAALPDAPVARPANVTPIQQPRTRRPTARVQKLVYPLASSQQ